ncbi:MAG TPA: carbohydrate binding domain-containing protein [Chthoniobacterales bacterium]|nr:carbohydrate binding domain-containing protein [Chthoniobacterales bacterium]
MNLRAVTLLTLFLVSVCFANAQESSIDVNRFLLEAIDGAEAAATVNNDGPNSQPAVTAVVSKTGLEFWSVELRAPDVNFEQGKNYEIKFQAKSVPSRYIYVVPEKVNGNQASVAEGTILHLSDQWTECTVVFNTTEQGNPGRLTISSLSTIPATFSFSNVRVSEK